MERITEITCKWLPVVNQPHLHIWAHLII